ncbi:hypothetical protein CD32_01670 [Lysinibacillus odysseyi 34hs-1 = NBRC 100172]|uniref:Right handed beta helix domain-containing protein n=2 Tax=Lysinibacillus odysseyi TaxID=202611 RepID=A0A0A3IUN2_9BACI|nr:hypothetical protein CD32_01670 [Lysinibacillus odysseyi 34hs-1 = NBRC 100172]
MFSGGEGTLQKPYLISTVEDFLLINAHLSAHFRQIKDIDFSEDEIAPIGTEEGNIFSGVYDGDNFLLNNVTIRGVGDGTALFDRCSRAILKNIHLNNANVYPVPNNGKTRSALLCNTINEGTVIENCHVQGAILDVSSSSYSSAGGAGIANISDQDCVIKKCSAHLQISQTGFAAGLVVFNGGEIHDSYAFLTVDDVYEIGTIVHTNNESGNVYNSYTVLSFTRARYIYFPCINRRDDYGFHNSFFDCNTLGGDDWEPGRYYYDGTDFVKGTDGNLYKCIQMQSDKDYSYWEPGWTQPPSWWPPPMYSARPIDGVAYSQYWEAIGPTNTEGARTTIQMKSKNNYEGWDFNSIWQISEGKSYPTFKRPKVVKCNSIPLTKLTVN